jgi:PAS domain S-box-containing protein
MDQSPPKYHRLVRIYYQVRASAFAALFVAIGIHMWGQLHGPVAWTLLVLQFLVYPHLLFLHARKAEDSLETEFKQMRLDCLLVGIWAAALEFPIWISFTLFLGTTLNNAINRGARGAAFALLAFCSGAILWGVAAGFRFSPETTLPVTVLCLVGLSIYVVGLGTIVFVQNRKLRDAREALRQSEERYRLITENAGDLIALLDAQGHFAYASPSYRRLLPPADLNEGDDALAYVHEDDRDAMRASLGKAIRTGKSPEFSYRLVAANGTTHQFQATVNSLSYAGVPKAVVVSIDVTELRQRDKILAVQAQAFENMAEAMMITSADGIILSVNPAFATITGYGAAEVVGKPEADFRLALQPSEYYDEIRDTLDRQGYWAGTSWCHRKNTGLYREWRSVSVIRDKSGQITHCISIFMDISESSYSASAPAHRIVGNAS